MDFGHRVLTRLTTGRRERVSTYFQPFRLSHAIWPDGIM
ncbi:hypothetical protein C4J83_3585 [Pseudomonas sp. LBUM920]|nr:hypothetical protein C4J83_3585 [Pseudomonas sp. LBUM920]